MKTKDTTQKKESLTIVNDQDNSNSGNEELIKKTEIPNSPFQVITLNGKRNFAVLGQYRLTEEYETAEEAIKAIEEMTWNNIMKLCLIIIQIMRDVEKQIIKEEVK